PDAAVPGARDRRAPPRARARPRRPGGLHRAPRAPLPETSRGLYCSAANVHPRDARPLREHRAAAPTRATRSFVRDGSALAQVVLEQLLSPRAVRVNLQGPDLGSRSRRAELDAWHAERVQHLALEGRVRTIRTIQVEWSRERRRRT